jgi:hypothetical protein
MTQTLETYQTAQTAQTSNFEKTSVGAIPNTLPLKHHKNTQKLTKATAKLQRQDIGWLDILTAMANIAAEEGDEEQVARVLEATALSLKRNRRVRRNL